MKNVCYLSTLVLKIIIQEEGGGEFEEAKFGIQTVTLKSLSITGCFTNWLFMPQKTIPATDIQDLNPRPCSDNAHTSVLKGACGPLTGDTPRIGAKGQIGSGESLGKCQEASLEYDIKERSSSNGPHPRMRCLCSPLWWSGEPDGRYTFEMTVIEPDDCETPTSWWTRCLEN